MAPSPRKDFNPGLLDKNEQTPAKIWELLRHNQAFRKKVAEVRKLHLEEEQILSSTKVRHSPAWFESYRIVNDLAHSFAASAIQWLVPDPVFYCWTRVPPPSARGAGAPTDEKDLWMGRGRTPNMASPDWVWKQQNKRDVGGHPLVRGPEIRWFNEPRNINSIQEWKDYRWPFTVEHCWADAPAGFQREFLFIWRNQFDCRSTNPITNNRLDSPSPHETDFFQGWSLNDIVSKSETIECLARKLQFSRLAADYRVFAIPKTILTKGTADEMGKWLKAELKKGSSDYGNLLKPGLLNDGELFGTEKEWSDWLAEKAGQTKGEYRHTHIYRRRKYITKLVKLIYPTFAISKLLAPPSHRRHYKS